MAVAVDASTPAIATTPSALAVTTASFNPPASILVACMHADPDRNYTMSNNGTAITWTLINERRSGESGAFGGSAHAYWAELTGSRTGMTVTATGGVASHHAMKLYVLTGADTADVVGGIAEGSSATNDLTTTSFTIETTGALGIVVGDDFSAPSGTTTSSDTTFFPYDVAGSIAGGSGHKALGSAGGSATFNLNAPGAAASEWNWIAFEIRAAGGAPTPLPRPPVTSAWAAAQRATI